MKAIKLLAIGLFVGLVSCENYEDEYLSSLEQIEALEKQIEDYSKQLEALTNQTIVDANQIEALNSKLAEVENALIEANELSIERKEALDLAHSHIAELEAEITELNETIEALEASGNASADLIAALQQEVEDAEAQIVYVQAEVEEIVEEANEVVNEPIAQVDNTPVDNNESNDTNEDDETDENVCNQDDKWYLNGENVFLEDTLTPNKSQFADEIGENVGTFVFTFRAKVSCTDYTVTVTSTKTIELGDEETEAEAGENYNTDGDDIDIVRYDNHIYTYTFSGFLYDGETEVDEYGVLTLVEDKTPEAVCHAAEYTWFEIVEEYADYTNKASGTYTEDWTDVSSDCTETVNTATIVVSEKDFNTNESSIGIDVNNDGDKLDDVTLPLKEVNLTFKGKTGFVIDSKIKSLAVVTVNKCANGLPAVETQAYADSSVDNLKTIVSGLGSEPEFPHTIKTYDYTASNCEDETATLKITNINFEAKEAHITLTSHEGDNNWIVDID